MRIAVRVRPGAGVDAVGGRWDGPRGTALLVAVRARAVEGRANAAVVEALAVAFGLWKAQVEVVSGTRGRDKTVDLDGDEPGARGAIHRTAGSLSGSATLQRG